ncbi:MAG: type I secretion C-terminal target domain-containing protein, partial [Mesorhizobium sp.]|uniref:beta strand repeat-containing protein n=1 Tax=Mesorhizobium sp. TaxID=1871066 RepID=UPI001212627F
IGFTSPDGIQTVSLGGHVLSGVPQTFTDATGSLTASYTYNPATGIGSISYSYTLLDNTSGDNTNASFAVVVTDADGDSAPAGNLVINIVDDVPTAHADTNSAQSGQTVIGNVETNDTAGADGIASIVWTGSSGNTVTGSFGTLTFAADGSYSYHANPNASGTEVFTYTITDGDGDTSPATLTITVANGQPQPVAATQTVNEAALDTTTTGSDVGHGTVTGSNPSSTAETVSGTLSLGDPDSPHLTNIQGSTSSVVGASPVIVQGTYGVLQIDQNGNYTYTLTKPFDTTPDANNGTNTETGKDVFTYTVTDAYGNTSTSTISINIIDDVPTAVAPDYAVLSNGAGNPVTFALDADHTVSNNYGADGPGTVQFATSLDGVDSGLTSGGTHIIYDVSADGHTLYGMANNVAVFTVTLDPANASYTVDMNGTVDSLTNIDFSGNGYDFVGGNKDWTGFVPAGDSVSSPINDNSSDLLLTAIGGSVNTSAIAGGVGTGASVGSGETFRVDFVQDLRNGAGSGYLFDQHYNTNGASAVFTATNGSTVQILAYDDHDTNNNLVGETIPADRSLDTITQVIVAYGGETYTFTSTGSHTIGGHSYTVTFNADGTVAVGGVYGTSGAQAVGTEIAVSTATGFNSIEYHYQAGDTFKIGEFGTAVQSTDPVNFNLPIETVDGDGDTAASGIGVTLYGTGLQDHSADTAGVSHVYTSTVALPNIIGSAYDDTLNGDSSGNLLSGGAGADTINGNGGNDTLVGGAGNDTLNSGAGNDLLIGGLGQDTLTGGTGADTFKLDHLELNIKDLITDYNGAEGDKIDLTALFETAPAGNIADYVHYNSGTNTLSVDANGTTGGANFVDVAQLTNAPAAGTINILYDDSNHVQHTATI